MCFVHIGHFQAYQQTPFHIITPPASKLTAMSTHTSPKSPLQFLQKRLKSLHDRRYNLDADFLSIRLKVGEMTRRYRCISAHVFQLLWHRDDSNYLRQNHAYMTSIPPQTIQWGIIVGRWDLRTLEEWMYRKMKSLRDLREISEFE